MSSESSQIEEKKKIMLQSNEAKYYTEKLKPFNKEHSYSTNFSGEIIIEVDKKGRWTYLNDSACRFWNKQSDELLGFEFFDIIHPDDIDDATATIREMIETGRMIKGLVNRLRTPDGWRIVEWNCAPIFEDEEYIGFKATGRDITVRKRYEERLEALHSYTARISSVNKLDEIKSTVLETVKEVLGFNFCGIAVRSGDKIRYIETIGVTLPDDWYIEYGEGVTSRVFKTGETQHISDVREDPDYIVPDTDGGIPEMRSELAVPVKIGREVIAVLNVESEKPNAFSESDRKLIEILVNHVSSIMNRLRYEERLEALHSFGSKLVMVSSLEMVAEETMEAVESLLGFKYGSFAIVEEDHLRFIHHRGSSTLDEMPLNGAGLTVRAANKGESQLVLDTRLDPDYVSGRIKEDPETLSELDVPVIIDGKVAAIINLEKNEVDGFTLEDQHLVETLALHVSSAIRRIRHEKKLKGLHRHGSQLGKAANLGEVYKITYDVLEDTLKFPIIDVIEVDGENLVDKFSIDDNGEPFSTPISGPGITARAVRTGSTQLINDTRKDLDYIKGTREWTSLSELVVPVMVEGEASAVLNLESQEVNAFSEQDKNLVEILAHHLASTIYNIEQREALIESLEEVERSNHELEDYAYVVSHDLKAPLRSISAFSSFLNEEYRIHLDEAGRDYLDRIINAAERMRELIQDLLVLSRVGRKYTEKEMVDLNKLVEKIKMDLKAQLEDGVGQILVGELPVINAQKVWMSQLFTNLIYNGLKFNKSPVPKVEIKFQENRNEYLFSIKDNGIGIRKADQKNLFKLFKRLHTPDEYEGTGAGLAIAKKIVDTNGGKIWLKSEPGIGTTFYFTYPKNEGGG